MSLRRRIGRSGWRLLCQAPLTMWLGMSVVDTITDSRQKEAEAFDKALEVGTKRFENSELIQAVIAQAQRPTKSQARGLTSTSPQDLLKQLERVSKVLAKRVETRDAQEFTAFLLDVGWTVAKASGESPLASCKVSEAEESFLYDADRALHSQMPAEVA